MKFSITTSFALSIFTFLGMAKADIIPTLSPGIPKTLEECLQQGASREVCEDFSDAQQNCADNHSNDTYAWRECLADAEKQYLSAVGGAPTGMPYVGESIPVSTNAADSRYEQKDPDHKGYKNAEE
jgi:hypothetical protein